MKKKATKKDKLTESQRRKKVSEYNRTYHRKVRKKRYEEDPDYRAKVVEANRERRKRLRGDAYEEKDYGAAAGHAHEFALPDSDRLGRKEMAEFIGLTDRQMVRWLEAGKIPPGNVGDNEWSVPYADALASILERMLKGRANYRVGADDDVIKALNQVNKDQ